MLAISGKHVCPYDTNPCQEECYDWQLEYCAHHKCQRQERGDVRVDGYGAVDALRHAVCSKETERDGEQYEIGHQHAKEEQYIYGTGDTYAIAALVLVEGWRHESEQTRERCLPTWAPPAGHPVPNP